MNRSFKTANYEATETIPFRFIAGNLHPDHDTLARFRATFLPELKDLVVQILLLAQVAGALQMGRISLDGSKIHADASKSHAVSYKRRREQEQPLRAEVVIFTARDLRALNQYRNKRLASRQAVMERRTFLLARNHHQRRDSEHKVTWAITQHAKAEGAKRLVVSDMRNIGTGKRLNTNAQQKVSGWSHGRQIAFLVYKLAALGIALARQSEAYSSKTCPCCGHHHKPKGRSYRCAACRFVGTPREDNQPNVDASGPPCLKIGGRRVEIQRAKFQRGTHAFLEQIRRQRRNVAPCAGC